MPLYTSADSSSKELFILTEVAKALTLPLALPALLETVMDHIDKLIDPAQYGLISLWDPMDGLIHPRASFGKGIKDVKALYRMKMREGESISGKVYGSKNALLLNSPKMIQDFRTDLRPSNQKHSSQAFGGDDSILENILAAPLRVGERNFGAFIIGTLNGLNVFTEDDLPFIQTLADLIALTIDRARLEADSAALREAEQADQLRAETLATLSHELRTPLATIKGYTTAMLLDEVEWPDEKRGEFLQLIDDECDNLQSMIADILDSSLIDVGQLQIEYQPVKMERIAKDAADDMQHRTDAHRILVDFPPKFPIIDADKRRIKQVIRNIIDNSIKYSPDGGMVIIRGEIRKKDVIISIADQGVGLAPEDLIPLFDKYFRVKSPVGYNVPGTGLGLPVARAIVEAHGGRIWAESKVGEGTKLTFSLPRSSELSESDY